MKAGDLRHGITFMKMTEGAADARGVRSVSWSVYKQTSAKIADVSGREFFEAAAYQMEDVVTFTVRWDSGLTADMRILSGGITFEILQINRLGYRGDYIAIKARSIRAEGGI